MSATGKDIRDVRPVRISRQESYLATRLAPVRVDISTGAITAKTLATGFFWEADGQWYLITNLHVLTGWNHEAGRALSEHAFSPSHVEFQCAISLEPPNDAGRSILTRNGYRISLECDGEPIWLEHPEFGAKVDVAALPLFETPDEVALSAIGAADILTRPVNRHPDWVKFEPAAADDAYVLGFPKGMSGGNGFPVWKRASIASEPDIDLDGIPKLLIDTATREGMSGSPVLAVRRGIVSPNDVLDDETIIGEAACFLGVYSGRIGDDPLGVQLGVVWKAPVIDEIIAGSKRGRWPWDCPDQTESD